MNFLPVSVRPMTAMPRLRERVTAARMAHRDLPAIGRRGLAFQGQRATNHSMGVGRGSVRRRSRLAAGFRSSQIYACINTRFALHCATLENIRHEYK